MPEMYLKQPKFTYSVCESFTKKTKKEFKNLKKKETQDIFTKVNYTKLIFNVIWLINLLKI